MGLEFLIISWLVSRYLVRNFWQDSLHAWRGEDPPSYRREQERFKAKQAKGEGPDTHRAAKRYFANAWNDAFETAEEKRARRRAKRLEKLHDRWSEEDGDRRDEGGDHDRHWDGDEPAERDESPPDSLCFYCGIVEATTACRNGLGDLHPACAVCAAARDRSSHQDGTEPDSMPEPEAEPETKPEPNAEPDPDPEPEPEPEPDPEPDSEPASEPVAEDDDSEYQTVLPEPTATVIAFPAMHTNTKENNMSAEIADLRAAINFTAESATRAVEGVNNIELALTGLRAGGTTGVAVTELQKAAECLTAAAACFKASNAELRRHLSVADQYQANQGAGEKEFLVNG